MAAWKTSDGRSYQTLRHLRICALPSLIPLVMPEQGGELRSARSPPSSTLSSWERRGWTGLDMLNFKRYFQYGEMNSSSAYPPIYIAINRTHRPQTHHVLMLLLLLSVVFIMLLSCVLMTCWGCWVLFWWWCCWWWCCFDEVMGWWRSDRPSLAWWCNLFHDERWFCIGCWEGMVGVGTERWRGLARHQEDQSYCIPVNPVSGYESHFWSIFGNLNCASFANVCHKTILGLFVTWLVCYYVVFVVNSRAAAVIMVHSYNYDLMFAWIRYLKYHRSTVFNTFHIFLSI